MPASAAQRSPLTAGRRGPSFMTRFQRLATYAWVPAFLLLTAVGHWQSAGIPPCGLDGFARAEGPLPAHMPAPEDPPADDEGDGPTARVAPIRNLTPEEINRIRYLELRAMRMTDDDRPDAVIVKIPPKTIEEFLDDKKGSERFQGEQQRRDFRKLTPPRKLHEIAKFDKDLRYVDKVQIETDPEVFVQFRKRVLPIVLQNCATAGCHSSTNEAAAGFRLSKDPKKLPVSIYTNFVTLCQIKVDNHAVIDRITPEESLLLTYMLPPKDVKPELQHPGDVKYKPGFPNRASNHYRTIENWIKSLKHPAEDYGVDLVRAEPAASQPADAPDEAAPADDAMKPPPKPKPRPNP